MQRQKCFNGTMPTLVPRPSAEEDNREIDKFAATEAAWRGGKLPSPRSAARRRSASTKQRPSRRSWRTISGVVRLLTRMHAGRTRTSIETPTPDALQHHERWMSTRPPCMSSRAKGLRTRRSTRLARQSIQTVAAHREATRDQGRAPGGAAWLGLEGIGGEALRCRGSR